MIENPGTYATSRHFTISEQAFLSCITEETACGLLPGDNNLYRPSFNNDFDAAEYMRGLAAQKYCANAFGGSSKRKLIDHAKLKLAVGKPGLER